MKKSFSTGLIILLPFALSIWVLLYLFDMITNPIYNIIESLLISYEKSHGVIVVKHAFYVDFISRCISLVVTIVLIMILGYLGRKFFFDSMIKATNKLIFKIPMVGTLYRLTKDITKAMLATDQKTFKESILIPFPAEEMYSVGFITGNIPTDLKKIIPSTDVSVFVPTAPHPISGYVLFCSRSSLKSINVSVEDTIKFLVSCGVIHPPTKP